MDEQKRLILAIGLSMLVLLVYQAFLAKQQPVDPPQVTQTQEDQGTDTQVTQPSQSTDGKELVPAGTVVAEPQRKNYRSIQVSTPLYTIAISEKGAAVKSFELKKYNETNDEESQLKQLISEELEQGVLFFDLEGKSIAGLKDAVYTAKVDADESLIEDGSKSIEFEWATAQGYVVKKVFTFKADSYLIDCDITIDNNTTGVLNDSLVISVPGVYTEEVAKRSRFAFEGPLLYVNNQYTAVRPKEFEITQKDKKKKEKLQEKIAAGTFNGQIGWAGFTERYFMTAVMPDNNSNDETVEGTVRLSIEDEIVTTRYIQKMERQSPGQSGEYSYTFYLGPKSRQVLKQYDNSLMECINFGGWFNILDILAKPLLITMNIIYGLIPNYGVAIILLTVLVKLVFWPLGTKSYKSMNQMKRLNPLMMEIREKYKDDRQRQQKEIMNLYRTYKVNPASGCLPIMVQMPIFFALYRMLYQAIELRHANFLGWVTDLSAPDRLFNFAFDVPFMENPDGIPMLTLLMGASFFLQQKMAPTAGDPTQAKMMMLMPIFMTVIFINFPSGLVLYMIINQIISIGQQYYIQKKHS